MARDSQYSQRCMEQVDAYRASGLRAKVWAEAHGVPVGTLSSWCAHYGRWQAKREAGSGGGHGCDSGSGGGEGSKPRPIGFVAARMGPLTGAGSVHIQVHAGAARLELDWPMAHARELAALLRELG